MKVFISLSILIHIITIVIVFSFYKRLQLLQTLNLPKVKELLEQTLNEIKDENNRLHQQLNELSKEENKNSVKSTQQVPKPKKEIKKKSPQKQMTEINAPIESLLKTKEKDKYEPSLHGQILQLHEKGLNHEEIAQKLNCGKTEVELILRFQQNQ